MRRIESLPCSIVTLLALCLLSGEPAESPKAGTSQQEENVAAITADYDEAWFVALKFPEFSLSLERSVFGKEGEPNTELFSWARRIRRWEELRRLKELLRDARNFNGGDSDWNLQLYSVVLYKRGKGVLEITPNLVGMQLGATPVVPNVRTWSGRGIREFAHFCHRQLAHAMTDSVAPPRSIGETLPKFGK